MANTDAPFGFIPYRRKSDAEPVTYSVTALATYATALVAGDPIVLSSGNAQLATTTATSYEGVIKEVIDESAGTSGKVVKVGTASTRRKIVYWKADAYYWAAQADGTITVGQTYGITNGAADANRGISGVEVDASTTHASTYGCKAIELLPANTFRAANAAGDGQVVLCALTQA